MLEALAESRRAQRQLIADASHELRTPLATVQANVELLSRAGELPPDERRQLREDLLSQLRELTGLVGDLVELARERAPESELEELDLAALVRGCIDARAAAPRRHFETSLRPSPVRGDRARLERAVTNLLDNARKWSPPDGTVQVTVADGELVVRDEGPGSTTPTARTCSTASTARPSRAACRARASASRSCARPPRCTAAPRGRRRRARPGAELHLRLPRRRCYFSDVQAKSHAELNSLATPFTLAERRSGCLSHSQFTTGACSVIMRSILAHAWPAPPGRSAARRRPSPG